MASSYSLRVPTTSISNASALPAPGPATVRLAMVRVGIEVFGTKDVQEELFPIIRSAQVRIKPPEKVALSLQALHAFKGKDKGGDVHQSLSYREFAHAEGEITIFLEVPTLFAEKFETTLQGIGYWGQANSLATCVRIDEKSPVPGEVAVPLSSISSTNKVKGLFTSFVTEFRDEKVTWEEITPKIRQQPTDAIKVELYVFPMKLVESPDVRSKILVRTSVE